jgi:transposase
VFDIPQVKIQVTEHQFEVKNCPNCHKKVKPKKSNFIKAPVQYGTNIKAFVSYLHMHHLVPEDRITQITEELFGVRMSIATVENIAKTCSNNVSKIVEEIETHLKTVPVKGADESGIRIDGKTLWLHTLCNDKLVHYRASSKRGDVPTDVTGVVVHDHFVSYFSKMDKVEHALCNAHHLRELKAVKEIDKEPWAKNMIRTLLLAHHYAQKNAKNITTEWLLRFQNLYDRIISQGLSFHNDLGVLSKPKRGRVKRRPGHNLLLRLKNRYEDVLRFLHNPEVPFTNNQSEQALRMIKIKQKISGSFRTVEGADTFLTVRSYTATAQKQGFRILDSFARAFSCSPIDLVKTYQPE